MARERRLGARQVEEIFLAFAEAMRELPPDIEAGWLDAQGDLRLAPDIARKLRTARRVRQLLQELRQRDSEDDGSAEGRRRSQRSVRAGDDPAIVQPADLGRGQAQHFAPERRRCARRDAAPGGGRRGAAAKSSGSPGIR